MSSRTKTEKLKHWRERAEEYRVLALACRSESVKDSYVALANSCDEMANSIEMRPYAAG